MSFFYNLNKRLQQVTADPSSQQLNESAYLSDENMAEASRKTRPPAPSFTKYTNYNAWDTEMHGRDAQYDETEVDGQLVGLAVVGRTYTEMGYPRNHGSIVGMWYNQAEVGSFVQDGTTFDDESSYAEQDPTWPYMDESAGLAEGSKVPTDWMGVPTRLGKNDRKPIQSPAGYDEYIKQGAKHGFQDDPNNPLRKRVKKAGVAEGASEGQGYYYLQGGIDKSKKFATKKEALAHVDQFFQHARVTRVTLRHKEPGKPAVVVREFNLNESVTEGRHTQSNALELNPDLKAQARKSTVGSRVRGAVGRAVDAVTGGDDEAAKGRLLNRMGGRRTPLAQDAMAEATKEIPGGRRHTADAGGYGRKDDEDEKGKKVKADATKRGRGRPKKDADADGEVKKYDWSAFGATGKDIKLPKHKGSVTRHKMADRDDSELDEATKEIPGGRRHTADAGGYGRRDDEDEKGKKVVSTVKRGRGRPKAGSDSETGEVKKYDFSAFGAPGKDIKLPKHKGSVTRHKMSDAEPKKKVDEDASQSDIEVLLRLQDQAYADGNNTLGNKIEDVLQMIEGEQNPESGGDTTDDEQVNEKAVSKKQQKFMGMVHAAKKGEKPASKEVAKAAKNISGKEAEKFASTKHQGLPEKKKKTTETTTAGSVATATDAKPKAASGGVQFGKGIYDSMNRELEQMIAESLNISANISSDAGNGPTQTLTVTATDEDADQLSKLLSAAGLGDSDVGAVDQVDENQADWPTDTEYSSDPFQYSGGLNKPKTTVAGDGQATGNITAVQEDDAEDNDHNDQLARMMEMAGIKESKPDYIDLDKDGDKSEPMKKAAKDAKDAKDDKDALEESIRNLWKSYKG